MSQEVLIPNGYECPISHRIMNDPVIAADNQTYERSEIEKWFEKSNKSPYTNLELPSKELKPNFALKKAILDFLEKNPTINNAYYKKKQQNKHKNLMYLGAILVIVGIGVFFLVTRQRIQLLKCKR